MSPPQRIDAHVHVFPEDVAADRSRHLVMDPAFREMYADPGAAIISAGEILPAMDSAGIARSIVCGFGWASGDLCRANNDAIIESVARHPDRITGFGTIAPDESLTDALTEIDRIAAAGLRGLGELRPDTQGLFDLDTDAEGALADRIRSHGMGLLLHASEPLGRAYPGKGEATPERLYGLLQRLTTIPTILAHAGGGLPFYAHLRGVGDVLADVYVDTAAMPYLYAPAAVRTLINAIGSERILFATDYPLMPQERVIRYLDEAGLSTEEMERVMFRNAGDFLRRVRAVQA